MTTQTSKQLPTRLREFAELVMDNYDGHLVDEDGKLLDPKKPRIPWEDDEEKLHEHGTKRRVVWVSRGGKVRATKQAGGRLVPGGSARVTLAAVRDADVEVHMFAESLAKVEALLDGIIRAISITKNGVVDFGGYSFETQETAQNGRSLRNQYAVLRFALDMPVVAEVSTLHDLDALDEDCGVLGEDLKIELSSGGTRVDFYDDE